MSRTVDNRVVELQFKNEQFIKAVTQSINSIESFERTLKTVESANHLKNLDKTISNIDFSTMKNSLSNLNDRFSALGIIGMSAISTLTSAVTNKLISAFEKLSSLVGSTFNQIAEGGKRRAANIEQANFALQGLLTGEYGDDVQTIKQKTKDISKIIDESVTDTAYSYDQAAKAASTMVATYGTTSEGIKKTSDALKGIVGVAAQTGAAYDQVSQVFSTVAGNGKAMTMQFRQVAGYGLNAAKTIADYLNAQENEKLLDKLKKEAVKRDSKGRIKEHLIAGKKITEQEVRKLATESFITADIWNNAFMPFYENASKANNTLTGVTSNINAALSRLGASFIQPIIKNEGPLVDFLNVVRQKVKDVLNVLNEFDIPKNVTDTITTFLKAAAEGLDRLDISKITLFEKLGTAIEVVSTAFNQKQDLKEDSVIDVLLKDLEDRQTKLEKSRKSYNDIIKEITGIKDLTYDKLINADAKIKKQLDDKGMSVEGLLAQVKNLYEKNNEEIDKGFSELEDLRKSYGERIEQIKDMTDIWHYDYFADITDAIYNFGDAMKTVFGSIFDVIGSTIPQLKPLTDIFTDKEKGAYNFRKTINDIAKGFKDFSEKVKDFVENNETFNKISKGVGSFISILIKGFIAIKDIGVNAFESFKPLFERLLTLGGIIGDFFSDINGSGNDVDTFGKIVEGVSSIIDKVAKAIISLYDGISKVTGTLLGDQSLSEFLSGILKKAKPLWDGVSSLFDNITSGIDKFFSYIGDKFSKAKDLAGNGANIFEIIRNFIKSLFGYEYGGELDEENSSLIETTDKVNGVLDKADGALNSITNKISDFSEEIKAIKEKISNAIKNFDVDVLLDRIQKVANIVLTFASALGIGNVSKGIKDISNGSVLKALFSGKESPFETLFNNSTKLIGSLQTSITKFSESFGFVGTAKELMKPKKYEAIAKIIKSLGEVLLMIGGAILLLSISMYIIAGISPKDLIKGGIVLAIMGVAIGALLIVIIKMAKDLKGPDSGGQFTKLFGGSSYTSNSAVGIIFGLAGVITVFGVAMLMLTKSIKTLSKIPEDQLRNATLAFIVISGIMVLLLAVIVLLVKELTKNSSAADLTKTGAAKNIASIAGVLITFGSAFRKIAKAMTLLGKLSEAQLTQGTIAFAVVGGIMAVLLAEIGFIIYQLTKGSDLKMSSLGGVMMSIAGVIFVFGIAMSSIMATVAILAMMPLKNVDSAINIVLVCGGLIGGIILIAGIAAALTQDNVSGLVGTFLTMSVLIGSLSIFMLAVGAMMAIFSAAGVNPSDVETIMTTITISLVAIIAVATLVGVLASKIPEVAAGIAIISLLFVSMGAWAVMIGTGVVLVGAGLILLSEAIEKFFAIFSGVDDAMMAKTIGGLTGFILGLVGVFVNGFVELLTLLDKLKKPIMKALISLISFGFEALLAWIPAAFQSLLNTASVCIDLLSTFLDDNHDKIVNIIDKLFDIIWEAMTVNSMSFLALVTGLLMQMRITLFGEDGTGGELLEWTNAILTYIDQLIKLLIMHCVAKMEWGLDYIQKKAPELADKLGETAEILLDGFANALIEHGPKIIDKIKLIGKIIPRLLLYAMGIGPAPEMGEFGSAGEKGKNPSDSGKEYLTSVSSGFKITETIRKKINDVVTGMVNTFKSLAWMFNPIGNLFASKLATGMNAELKIKSPSKVSEETAYWYVKGAEKGVVKNAHIAADSAADMARGMIVATDNEFNKGFKELKENNSDIIDYLLGTDTANNTHGTRLDKLIASAGAELKKLFTDFSFLDNLEFTITPDMDLTKITEGMDSITSMFGNTNEEINVDSVNANTVKASGIETLLSKINPLGDMSDPNNANNVVVNLTQNNYSPESLSRIDIYRDTKNLLSSTPSIVSNLPV